jgi:hypothetical protein
VVEIQNKIQLLCCAEIFMDIHFLHVYSSRICHGLRLWRSGMCPPILHMTMILVCVLAHFVWFGCIEVYYTKLCVEVYCGGRFPTLLQVLSICLSVDSCSSYLQVGGALGWRAAFWIESLLMLPLAIFGFVSKEVYLKGLYMLLFLKILIFLEFNGIPAAPWQVQWNCNH